jgi:hypothetical protein
MDRSDPVIAAAAATPTGAALVTLLEQHGWEVVFDDLDDADGWCYGDKRLIEIDQKQDFAGQLATLVHEARHAEQFSTVLGAERVAALSEADSMLWARLMEADAFAIERQVLAEHFGDGCSIAPAFSRAARAEPQPWYDAFEAALRQRPEALYDGSAYCHAFAAFLLSNTDLVYERDHSVGLNDAAAGGMTGSHWVPQEALAGIARHYAGSSALAAMFDGRVPARAVILRHPAFALKTTTARFNAAARYQVPGL